MKDEIEKWERGDGIKLLKKIGIKPGQTVLDFGCRNGTYTIPAARIVGERGLVYALDKNSEALDKLIQEAKKEDLPVKRIDTEGEINISLEDEIVDVVLLYDVIHLVGKDNSSTVDDRNRLYEEVCRVAKNGALISVYPTHLKEYTDISSAKEAKEELKQHFQFERGISSRLVHDDEFENGEILNFRKTG